MKTTHLIGLLALGGAVAGMGFGCSSDPAVDDGAGGTGGGGDGGATSTSNGPGPGSGGGGGSMIVDEGTSCADAVVMEEVQNQAGGTFYQGLGVINPAQDADFFTFTANAGDWIWLATDANPDDNTDFVDTVITLYNEDGDTQLAQVDDAFPRITTDSEMFYRVETGGTFCLKVEEFSDWAGQTPEGDPTFTYRAIAIPVDFTLYEQFNEDSEPNDDPTAAQTGLTYSVDDMSNQVFTQLAGTFASDTDADFYEFTAPQGSVGMFLSFTPGGTDGFGASTEPGVVNIHEVGMGNMVTRIATLDQQNGSDGFSSVPITAGGTYLVEVNKQSGAAGSNPFYFLKLGSQAVLNEQETDDTANNSSATPSQAAATANGDTTSYFLGGNTPANDTDWWAIPNVNAGDIITVVCSAQRAGSGVADFTVEYYGTNPQGAATQSQTEDAMTDILWSNSGLPNVSQPGITAGAAGTHYFSMSATMGIANVASNFYLCGIHVAAP